MGTLTANKSATGSSEETAAREFRPLFPLLDHASAHVDDICHTDLGRTSV